MLDPALAELAEHYGIEPGYHDIWGVWHEVSAETVRELLSAMGVHGARDVDRAMQAAKSERWSRILPEAVVVRRSALAEGIMLRISGSPRGRLDWRIVEERGRVREGSSAIGELRRMEEEEVEGIPRHGALLPLPPVPVGYHRLELALGSRRPRTAATLIVAPERCFLPETIARGERVWGLVLQLYGLRSARNWGIGDFGDLAETVGQWAGHGAAFVGVNPLHALYPANPAHASPYSPSSRRFLNPLYLEVEAIEEFAECAAAQDLVRSPGFAAQLERLRGQVMVDYPGVAAAKTQVLALLHAHFSRSRAGSRRRAAFEAFCRDGGEALRRFAVYEALYEHFHSLDAATGSWMQWPQAYRDPQSAEVAQFARDKKHRVEFFLYLQWQAAAQLAAAGDRCRQARQDIGLYLDLAVSIDRGGADAWADQALYALGASVGAPPDEFNRAGQDWGLPPCNPQALQRTGYAAFVDLLRANMAAAGALRIDHVMGLARLFWLPLRGGATRGAYVRYPLADLLAIIALESERNRCMVIGEDLGTVPVQLRCALRQWGVLSYRLLMFERDPAHRFQPPAEYPVQSMVAFSTHDLPTFAGYWRAQAPATRQALLAALGDAALLPEGATDAGDLPAESLARLSHAVHLYLARSPALALALQLDDLAGAAEQANVPGTPDEAPNWRRKLPATLESMRTDVRLQQLGDELGAARAAAARPVPRNAS
jgi:(1->4)-alpha-D-glucan 1-alpha-D-glucosylmutase